MISQELANKLLAMTDATQSFMRALRSAQQVNASVCAKAADVEGAAKALSEALENEPVKPVRRAS